MVSEKQFKANRKNATKGGVKTPEGKAIVRYNALKHGLLSTEVLLEKENEQNLNELETQLRSEIKPKGELEMLLTDRIITNFWRLKRALEVEKNIMEWQRNNKEIEFDIGNLVMGIEPEEQNKKRGVKAMIVNNDIDKLLRYETTIERSIYKALHELQRIQSARRGEKPPAPVVIDIDVSKD